jgi:hypothetical protein
MYTPVQISITAISGQTMAAGVHESHLESHRTDEAATACIHSVIYSLVSTGSYTLSYEE